MLENTIRNFFILITSIYAFYKLLNITPRDLLSQIILLVSSSIICIISALLFNGDQAPSWLLNFFMLFLLITFMEQEYLFASYTTILFSYSLSFISFCISIILSALIMMLFYFENYEIPWLLMQLLIGILQFGLIYYCFRIPRLQKSMIFLYHIPSGNIGFTLCVVMIMLALMFCQSTTMANYIILIFYSCTLILGFLLIYWWNYHITQTYRKFLRKNEIDSLNLLLEERNQEIAYLKSENDKLSRIIHKDNKIIPALSMAVIDSYENKTTLDLSGLESDSSLLIKLKQLYNEREETLANYQQEIVRLPQTAFDSVNAILSYMQAESLNANIPFQVMLFDNLDSTIPNEIAEDDFTHMLSDLLANAINACRDITSSSIQVYLGKMDGISTIKVLNTGNIFDIDTLKDLGLVRHTTHADTGGCGIGLMDIWSIKERYGATLLIDEFTAPSTTYTCVNILFNHKKHYIIQSNRHKELSSHINRPDMMIISKE